MKRFLCICVAAAISLATGCGPTMCLVWSPDGTRAVILGDDGLHLCDVNGKLTGVLAPKADCVAWMPDGKQIIVAAAANVQSWDVISVDFPKDAATADKNVDAVRSELLASTGDWKKFSDSTPGKLHLSGQQFSLALIDLRDHERMALEAKLSDDMRKGLEGVSMTIERIQSYTVGDAMMIAGPVLRTELATEGGAQLRISPTAAAVAVNEKDDLLVLALDASGSSCDLGPAAEFPDWSPDGRFLVYQRPYNWHEGDQDGPLLGTLSRSRVIDDNGMLFDADHLPKPEDLAGLVYDEGGRVRVAKDGRIFFSGMDVTLPTTMQDVKPQKTIFSFEPGKQTTLTRVIPNGAAATLGDAAEYFELSPDARYISIPFSNGRVSVLDNAATDNDAVLVQEKPDDLRTVPSWRTATELTFMRPDAASGGQQLVRYSMPDKSVAVLSVGWPKSALGVLYTAPATQPATQPVK